MKTLMLMLLGALAFPCPGAEPFAPFQFLLQHRTNLQRTALNLQVTAITNTIAPISMRHTNGRTEVLAFPVRIANLSTQTITAKIAHEWYGGEWPPTDLYAAVNRMDDKPSTPVASEVFLLGESGSLTAPTTWKPGQSNEFTLRLNWPGTGSVKGTPLIDSVNPGKYSVRVLLTFRRSGQSEEYFESPPMEVTVGDSSSFDQAITILDAKSEKEGIQAEYAWLQKHFPGYRRRSQALLGNRGRAYDRLDITTANGQQRSVYFDITDFFGK